MAKSWHQAHNDSDDEQKSYGQEPPAKPWFSFMGYPGRRATARSCGSAAVA